MAAMNILLVDLFVTAAAVRGRQAHARDHKPVMVLFVLARRGLVALQTIHAFLAVLAHFIFMHHGILEARVTLRTFARSPHETRIGLLSFDSRTRSVKEKRAPRMRAKAITTAI